MGVVFAYAEVVQCHHDGMYLLQFPNYAEIFQFVSFLKATNSGGGGF